MPHNNLSVMWRYPFQIDYTFCSSVCETAIKLCNLIFHPGCHISDAFIVTTYKHQHINISLLTQTIHIQDFLPFLIFLTVKEFHYLMCDAGGGAVGCLWFTMSSPWQGAEKSSCLSFHRYAGGEKTNRLRIQCPQPSHLSLCWPWPLPLSRWQIIPVVMKRFHPP